MKGCIGVKFFEKGVVFVVIEFFVGIKYVLVKLFLLVLIVDVR